MLAKLSSSEGGNNISDREKSSDDDDNESSDNDDNDDDKDPSFRSYNHAASRKSTIFTDPRSNNPTVQKIFTSVAEGQVAVDNICLACGESSSIKHPL